jgi:hypothetical protein
LYRCCLRASANFSMFLAGYQYQGAPLSELEGQINVAPFSEAERAAMIAAVEAAPEPSGVFVIGVAAAAASLARRRRC